MDSLKKVLDAAFEQAASGKGKERHGSGKPFTKQPMIAISQMLESAQFCKGQAIKKIVESNGLQGEARTRELLGAINYIAGAIIYDTLQRDTKGPVSDIQL